MIGRPQMICLVDSDWWNIILRVSESLLANQRYSGAGEFCRFEENKLRLVKKQTSFPEK
jgi:hypothetical protein